MINKPFYYTLNQRQVIYILTLDPGIYYTCIYCFRDYIRYIGDHHSPTPTNPSHPRALFDTLSCRPLTFFVPASFFNERNFECGGKMATYFDTKRAFYVLFMYLFWQKSNVPKIRPSNILVHRRQCLNLCFDRYLDFLKNNIHAMICKQCISMS